VVLLHFGDVEPKVVALQMLLNSNLLREELLEVDGIFGRQTLQSVLDFQKQACLKQDGVVGPHTWEALVRNRPFSVIDAVDVTDPGYFNDTIPYLRRAGGDPVVVGCLCNGIQEALRQILAKVSAAGSIVALRFHGHGNTAIQSVSDGIPAPVRSRSSLSRNTVAAMQGSLGVLQFYFASFGSVEMHGCNVGYGPEGRAFLALLANLWGVPVSAGVGFQREGGWRTFRLEGPVQTAFPRGATLKTWAEGQPEPVRMSAARA